MHNPSRASIIAWGSSMMPSKKVIFHAKHADDDLLSIFAGLKYLNNQLNGKLFHPELAPYQFSPNVGYTPKIADTGDNVTVTDLNSALSAIKIIVDQGEGNPGPYDDPGKLEKDHYDKFRDLKDLKLGPWDCYPVRSNPVTIDYRDKDKDLKLYYVCLSLSAQDNSLIYCVGISHLRRSLLFPSFDNRKAVEHLSTG